jgi:hypothetical protein
MPAVKSMYFLPVSPRAWGQLDRDWGDVTDLRGPRDESLGLG